MWNAAAKYFDAEMISSTLGVVTGIVALLYMISKWRGQILSNRREKMELKELERLKQKRDDREKNTDRKV